MEVSVLERKIVTIVWTTIFTAIFAGFASVIFTHANTFALADPIIRWFIPHASAEQISNLHILGRKLGHFFIPAGAYFVLILGPLRNRPYIALALCAMFAMLDETLQTVSRGRTGSIADVALDMAGALSAFFACSAFANFSRRAANHLTRAR